MSSTIDYRNANADWRFVIADLRNADGSARDLTGFAVSVTFRPDADRTIDIADCTTSNGAIVVTPGAAGDPNASPPIAATGPTITICASAASRTWCPARPTLVVGDVMISKPGTLVRTEDAVKRLAFVAMPGT